jgi:hypothetical protein
MHGCCCCWLTYALRCFLRFCVAARAKMSSWVGQRLTLHAWLLLLLLLLLLLAHI